MGVMDIEGLTAAAEKQADALGLTCDQVLEMVRRSAPHRDDDHGLNRIFKDHGFKVGTTAVHSVVRLNALEPNLTQRVERLLEQALAPVPGGFGLQLNRDWVAEAEALLHKIRELTR